MVLKNRFEVFTLEVAVHLQSNCDPSRVAWEYFDGALRSGNSNSSLLHMKDDGPPIRRTRLARQEVYCAEPELQNTKTHTSCNVSVVRLRIAAARHYSCNVDVNFV